MLKKLSDDLLVFLDVLLMVDLLFFELLGEFIDPLFLLVQDFVFLFFLTRRSTASSKLLVDFLDVGIVGINHTLGLKVLFVKGFELDIVLLDAVLESITSLREWKVHLVGLKLEILLLLDKSGSLLLQVLGSLLQGITTKSVLSLDESSRDLFEFLS